MRRSKIKYRKFSMPFAKLNFNEFNIQKFVTCILLAREQSRRDHILSDREGRVRFFINNLRNSYSDLKICSCVHEPRNWLDAGIINPISILNTSSDPNYVQLQKFCEAAMLRIESEENFDHDSEMDLRDLNSLIKTQEGCVVRMQNILKNSIPIFEDFVDIFEE